MKKEFRKVEEISQQYKERFDVLQEEISKLKKGEKILVSDLHNLKKKVRKAEIQAKYGGMGSTANSKKVNINDDPLIKKYQEKFQEIKDGSKSADSGGILGGAKKKRNIDLKADEEPSNIIGYCSFYVNGDCMLYGSGDITKSRKCKDIDCEYKKPKEPPEAQQTEYFPEDVDRYVLYKKEKYGDGYMYYLKKDKHPFTELNNMVNLGMGEMRVLRADLEKMILELRNNIYGFDKEEWFTNIEKQIGYDYKKDLKRILEERKHIRDEKKE